LMAPPANICKVIMATTIETVTVPGFYHCVFLRQWKRPPSWI
jgi:hypothetical protein